MKFSAGFPMIGIAGVIGDVGAAASSSAAMPNLARRLWLVSREAHVRKNEKGKFTLENLGKSHNHLASSYQMYETTL